MQSPDGNGANGDVDVAETNEWLDSLESVLQNRGQDRARFLLTELEHKAIRDGVQLAFHRQHALHQHDSAQPSAALSRQPRNRAPHQEPGPLERHGDGGAANKHQDGHRRPYLHLCVRGDAL